MKLLIIGGTGVLSSAVVNEALKRNFSITIINRGKKKKTIPQGVEFIEADYRDKPLMERKLANKHYDAVIDFIVFNKEEITYSINLLHTIAEQYVFISTACVYDTQKSGVKKEEAEKVLKEWDYSVNKWECEKYLVSEAKKRGFNYTIIRPCITYDDTRIPYGIMPKYGYHWTFVARVLTGKPILRWNGGNTRWNMMRVEDFAVGVVGVLGNPKAYGEAFNLSGDNAYSWNDVISALHKILGVNPILFDITTEEYIRSYPEKKGEIIGRSFDLVVDNSKIKELVPSYNTSYSLYEGIEKTIAAYKKQDYQHGIDWKFDANIDRIITRLCEQKRIDKSQYKLSFVDYIGTATATDHRLYWLEFHKNNIFIRFCYKLFLLLKTYRKDKRNIKMK